MARAFVARAGQGRSRRRRPAAALTPARPSGPPATPARRHGRAGLSGRPGAWITKARSLARSVQAAGLGRPHPAGDLREAPGESGAKRGATPATRPSGTSPGVPTPRGRQPFFSRACTSARAGSAPSPTTVEAPGGARASRRSPARRAWAARRATIRRSGVLLRWATCGPPREDRDAPSPNRPGSADALDRRSTRPWAVPWLTPRLERPPSCPGRLSPTPPGD